MKRFGRLLLALAGLALGARESGAQQSSELVRSSDRELGELAAALLPDLARRAGMELKEPVRLERRTREQLVRYLRAKLDEELPEEEARATVDAYAMLGMVADTLDLRAVLLALYTEQVAGFYEPDSTALFVLDDQPETAVQGLLVHELVHAVQDQTVDLHALVNDELGNDRQTAAQAAIEGHATLVMLEYLTEQMRGAPVDLAEIPDFSASLRPALEGIRSQFPALASAPPVIQESLLFPYVAGAGYVQSLWHEGERVPPFGEHLPRSTEQVLTHDLADAPVSVEVEVVGGEVVRRDDLGRLETGVLLDTHAGAGSARFARGWGGDRYVLVRLADGASGLAWVSVWDAAAARDAFVGALAGRLQALPRAATLTPLDVGGRAGALLRVGLPAGADVRVRIRR
jgi:hypothetical protein